MKSNHGEHEVEVIESDAHSFVVKIWLEESAEEAGSARWRGYITHVHTGKRRYFEHLSELSAFIVPYLESMQVRTGKLSKIRQWLHLQ